MTRAALVLLLVSMAPGCGDRPTLQTGDTCTLTSDCESPLVCRLERCREECFRNRDCPAGQVCLRDDRGLGACQVEQDECTTSADCNGALVCHFGRCTNQCMTIDDCPAGAVCDDGACVDGADVSCERNSDCLDPLICATDEQCREQCVEDRDCRDGASCVTMGMHQVCVKPGGMDAGVDGGDAVDAGTGVDAAMVGDAGIDGGVDAGMDSGMDAGMDAGIDAGMDGGTDGGFDGGMDGGPDGGPDAGPGTDAGTGSFGPTTSHRFVGGALHTCAVTDVGQMWCWGANDNGQVGDGTITQRNSPVLVGGLSGIVEGTAGGRHSCGRTATALWCWGDNANGQLGDGTTTERHMPTPISLGFTSGAIVRLAAGDDHTCALDDAGDVWCWGANANGQLGDGTTTDQLTAVRVTGLSGAAQSLCADGAHTCALMTSGEVQCWGYNFYGELGDGTNTDSSSPVTVSGLSGVEEVACGTDHTCARMADGTVRCWGLNTKGQLGDGTLTNSNVPVTVPSVTGVTQLALGIFHTCARQSTGGVMCWGTNTHYQIGVTPAGATVVFDPVSSMASEAVEIGAGTYHNCYRNLAGNFLCFGRGSRGQLGDGLVTSNPAPVPTGL